LYLFIVLSILATSSDLWFHAHNWAIGASDKPRLLQSDGSFKVLPAGMLACELPDQSLAFLREIMLALLSWKEKFAPMLKLAENLPERLQTELKERIPAAYTAASKQYLKHLVSYQLLPFSLGRLSEPSSPAFCSAIICTFFPALAEAHKLHWSCIDDGADVESHWSAADEMLVVANAEDVCTFLSTALVEGDVRRQQRCHERLFEIAIEMKAADVETKYLNSVREKNAKEFDEMKRKSQETGQPMTRRAKKNVGDGDTKEASRLKQECIDEKRVFTLGLLESCKLDDLQPNTFLSQLLRIALSSRLGEIKWGEKCTCDDPSCHENQCWWTVCEIYFFLETEFFHLFIHQMWVEGAFNRLSNNQCNSSPELMNAKLHGAMNGTAAEVVDSSEINKKVKELQKIKLEQNKDVDQKKADITEHFCSKPTKQRQVRSQEQKEQDEKEKIERAALKKKEKEDKAAAKQKDQEERAAATVANRARKVKEKEHKAATAAVEKELRRKAKVAAADLEEEQRRGAKAAAAAAAIGAPTEKARKRKPPQTTEPRKKPMDLPPAAPEMSRSKQPAGTEYCRQCWRDVLLDDWDLKGECCANRAPCVELAEANSKIKRVRRAPAR